MEVRRESDFSFRTWDEGRKIMTYYKKMTELPYTFSCYNNPMGIIVMQATMTISTNGGIVWEGDILKYNPYRPHGIITEEEKKKWLGKLYVVEWSVNRFIAESVEYAYQGKDIGFGGSYCGGAHIDLWCSCHDFEILGNKWEHPELLIK